MSKTLIRSSKVLTFDDANPVVEAVLVDNGVILDLGRFSDLVESAGPNTQIMEAGEAVVMPGLIDTHPHVMHFGALRGGLVDLSDAVDHADIVERIRARAVVTAPGEWIICTPVGEAHYFIRRSWRDLAERRLPDRHALDQATTDHPVLIQAWAPRTPNIVAFNSAGLRTVGLSDFIPDRVCDVEIDKDEAGRLTGILRGPVNNYYTYDPFWGQILLKLPPLDPDHAVPGVLDEMARFSARGVTTLYEGHAMEPIHIQMYQHLRAADLLTIRVQATHDVESVIFYPFEPLSSHEFDDRLKSLAPQSSDTADDMFRIDGMTISPGGPVLQGISPCTKAIPTLSADPPRGIASSHWRKKNRTSDSARRTASGQTSVSVPTVSMTTFSKSPSVSSPNTIFETRRGFCSMRSLSARTTFAVTKHSGSRSPLLSGSHGARVLCTKSESADTSGVTWSP